MSDVATVTEGPVTGPRYQEYMRLSELRGNLANPKSHDLPLIEQSMGRFGYIEPITLDERTGLLISGHGRVDGLKARKDGGRTPPEGVVTDADAEWWVPVNRGWSSTDDVEAEAALVALNETTTAGGWVEDKLIAALNRQRESVHGLTGTGYNEETLKRLIEAAPPPEPGGDSGTVKSNGSLLELTDVTFGDPRHTVASGEVYRIGEHFLIIADVMTEWSLWTPYLVAGALFVPYPGPYAALSEKAENVPMVMVQPDHFLAGHLLDKYQAVKGEDAVVRIVSDDGTVTEDPAA